MVVSFFLFQGFVCLELGGSGREEVFNCLVLVGLFCLIGFGWFVLFGWFWLGFFICLVWVLMVGFFKAQN